MVRSQLAPIDLQAIQQPMRAELDEVLSELGRIIASDFPLITEVNEHLLRMKGKMFRPTRNPGTRRLGRSFGLAPWAAYDKCGLQSSGRGDHG
jgi:hypothetical protein